MNFRTTLASLAVLAAFFVSIPAHATVQRTFVSMAFGSDANVATGCAPTAPCRFFQAAMSATTSGGEVVVLDSGGYGTVNIDRSISLIAPAGIYGGITVFTGDGVLINTASLSVTLKGLTINGMGGTNGINMTNGSQLNVHGVSISGFTSGRALMIQAPAVVSIKNTTITNVYNGIVAGSTASVTISESTLSNIQYEGVAINGGTTGTTTITASDTTVNCNTGSTGYGFDNYASANTVGRMFLTRITATGCYYGVLNEPQTPTAANILSLGASLITGNSYGLYSGSGGPVFYSANNNQVVGNSVDITGTVVAGGVH